MGVKLPIAAVILSAAPFSIHAEDVAAEAQNKASSANYGLNLFNQRVESEAATLRALWFKAHQSLPSDSSPPAITSGVLNSKNLNVAKAPAALRITLRHTDNGSGIRELGVAYSSNTTGQTAYIDYYNYSQYLKTNNPTILQSPNGPNAPLGNDSLSIYAAPGTYTITQLSIIDGTGSVVYYTQAEAASILGGNSTFTVVNNVSPDTTAPTFTTGKITTKRISLSADVPEFIADINVNDDISGVTQVYFELSPDPNGNNSLLGFAASKLSAPVFKYDVPVFYTLQSTTPTGKYYVSGIQVCDLAGNCTHTSSERAVISALGYNSFNVVP